MTLGTILFMENLFGMRENDSLAGILSKFRFKDFVAARQ
jgi:hypothetical protein